MLPLVVTVLLAVVQVGLLVRDEVVVVHAAREAARAAAVDRAPDAAWRAAAGAVHDTGVDPGRLAVDVTGRAGAGSHVRVTVRYHPSSAVPIVGRLVSAMTLTGTATMRVER